MTTDAQNALRRVMEKYSGVTRFCLICNYVSRIIAPIASRCAKFHFKALDEATATAKLGEICRREGAPLGAAVLRAINRMTAGDLRQGVTLLQSAKEIFGAAVSPENLSALALEPPAIEIESLLKPCGHGDVDKIRRAVAAAVRSGFSTKAMLAKLCEHIATGALTDAKKASAARALAAAEVSVANGADPELQLLNVMCQIDSVLRD